MAVSDTGRTEPARTVRRDRAAAWDETKSSLKTTEFWAMVFAIAAVLVASSRDDSLDGLWAWGFVSAIVIGYMLSRGFAKSGSRHPEDDF